jgi:hypothetical protein
MRDVRPGDVVLHLTDNEGFTGISRAKRCVSENAPNLFLYLLDCTVLNLHGSCFPGIPSADKPSSDIKIEIGGLSFGNGVAEWPDVKTHPIDNPATWRRAA